MKRHPIRIAIFCFVAALFLASAAFAEEATPSADTLKAAWIKVQVETSYGFFWQKSTGRAYVMTDPEHPRRAKAGKLFVQIMAHDTTTLCVENADSAVVFEKKRGIAISKKTARVTAWSENPNLKPVSETLNP